MRTIFMDECGFTGPDLMNEDQPMFALASHNFEPTVCVEMKKQHFASYGGKELKHAQLAKTARGQGMVVEFMKELGKSTDRLAIGLAHKRFTIVLKIVDLIVEEAMHADGLDLYRDGGNVALGNLWHAMLSLDPALYTRVGKTFQAMVRAPSQQTVVAFVAATSCDHPLEMVKETLQRLLLSFGRLEREYVAGLVGRDLDLCAAIALPVAYRWKERLGVGFDVVHDQSSNMAKSKWLWDLMVAPDAPAAVVGAGGWSASYPIGVTQTQFASSLGNDAIQIADVVAGATARWASWMAGTRDNADAYASALNAAFFEVVGDAAEGQALNASTNPFATVLWPSTDVSRKVTPPGMASPIDYTMELIKKNGVRDG
jgi:hypothetical protein